MENRKRAVEIARKSALERSKNKANEKKKGGMTKYFAIIALCVAGYYGYSTLSAEEDSCKGHEPHLQGTLLSDGTYWGPWDPSMLKFEGDIDSLLINRNVEVMASGFLWAEGPVWVQRDQALLFSDVPGDKIYRLTKRGAEVFIDHSGGWDAKSEKTNMPDYHDKLEHGSNGLTLHGEDLIICHHGIRSVTKVNYRSIVPGQNHNDLKYEVIADKYEGNRLNSPNDVVADKHGDLWFTDPLYGFMLKSDKGLF